MIHNNPSIKRLQFVNVQPRPHFQVLEKIYQYLPEEDVEACKLVCKPYIDESQCIDLQEVSKFEPLTQRNEILDNIFGFLGPKDDLCSSRLICLGFNSVSKRHLVFSPVLTDTTSKSILQMDNRMRVNELRVEDLHSPLPVDEDGFILSSLRHENVKTLSFFEGVSKYNKNALICSFPFIDKLRYIWATSFVMPEKGDFQHLTSLQIRGVAHTDNGNLETFFSKAQFPQLERINIELHFRRDLSLYMELHRFIGNHSSTLRNLELEFRSFSYPDSVRENAGSMLILLSNELINEYNQIVEQLKRTELESFVVTFLDFEGTSMFHLGFTLLLAQKRLKNLTIIKEYTKTRRECLPLYVCIKKNEKTLENLSIPHPYSFNCSALSQCPNLKSLTVGRIWGPRFMDSKAYFVEMLPTNTGLHRVHMGIKMSFLQIYWIVHHLHLTVFEFRGNPNEPYTLGMVQTILKKQKALCRLEFECEMTLQEFKIIKIYFNWTRGIKMDWAHFDSTESSVSSEHEGNGTSRGEFQVAIDPSVFDVKV